MPETEEKASNVDKVWEFNAEGADANNGIVRCSAGHPRRWLDADENGRQRCPDCGRVYQAVEVAVLVE